MQKKIRVKDKTPFLCRFKKENKAWLEKEARRLNRSMNEILEDLVENAREYK